MAINLTDINTKLVDISTQYSKFNKNQVLTETQLNGFLDYFDDQDRLTRTSLSGVGIVCGFKVIYSADDHTIKVTQGRGVTTDGDLLALQDQSETEAGKKDSTLKSIDLSSKTFSFYKKFSDNKAMYKHFIKPDNNVIDLWELHEDDADSHTSLSEFPSLSNMVVLLYVESYSKEGDLCTQLTCDNQGIEQVSRLRVLLVSPQNAQYLIGNDPIFKGNDWYETYLSLPEVSAKRIILDNVNTKTNRELKKSYFDVIKGTSVLAHLGEGLDAIFDKFDQSPVSHLVQKLFDFNQTKIPTDFQYRYDLLKDFIDTYNEIKEILLDLNVQCCPAIGSFPKHLLIGRLVETKEYLSFRHSFYKSPIIASDNEKYRKVLSLLGKIKELANEYKLTNKGEEIKITPSLTQAKLSDKSIPFYYNVSHNLLEKWSFKTSKYLRTKYNLSYHTDNLVNVPSVKSPLDYNLDPFDFYRIEGHQGKLYRDALDQITQLKQEKGLSFDVKVLSIETDKESLDISEHKCHFDDLGVLLGSWRAEQDCILSEVSEFLSGFSIETAGENTVAGRKGLDKMAEAEMEASLARMKEEEVAKSKEVQIRSKKLGRRQNNLTNWMVADDNSIGMMLTGLIQDNSKGSVSDIMLGIMNAAEEIASQENWTQDTDLSKFILEDVTQLLLLIFMLDDNVPDKITEIDENTLAEYKEVVDKLCTQVTAMQAQYDSLELTQGTKQYLGLLFSQLTTVCCSAKKLEVLFEEIQSRKENILKKTQLCEFVKSHPGLEHKAGVIPGGTFVMVYLKEAEESEPSYPNVLLEIPFLEQPQISEDGLSGDSGKIELWENKFSPEFTFVKTITEESEVSIYEAVLVGETVEQTVANLAEFLNITWENADGASKVEAIANENILLINIKDRSVPAESYFMRFNNPATVGSDAEIFFEANSVQESSITTKNTVIADFSLPYMCCSDCTPINFIIPEEPIFLSLPVSYICLKEGEDIDPIPFNVSPADGEVEAVVPEGIPSGVTTDANGNPVFDATLMDASLHGQEIGFTVNGEETDCKIIVYADVPLTVTTSVAYNEMKTEAVVSYMVDFYPNLFYSWDYGNGISSNQVPEEGKIEVVYELPVGNDNTIQPGLKVSNGFCEKEVPIDPITFEELEEVVLEIQDSFCLNISSDQEVSIPFTQKQPQEAEIAVVGGDRLGLEVKEGEIVLIPFEFQDFNTPIAFTLGGQPTGAEITIGATFNVQVNENEGTYNWVNNELHYEYSLEAILPNNVDPSNAVYKWMIGEEEVGNDNVVGINLPVEKDNGNTEISVEVSLGGPCTSNGSITVGVPYPDFRLRMPGNKLSYCIQDDKFYTISVDPDIPGTVVEGNGVSKDNNGNPRFRVADTGMENAGKVGLGIAGDQLLELTIKVAPVASFTAKIEGEELVLTNTSDEADLYKWDVGGIPIEHEAIKEERIPIATIDGDFINIVLEAVGECGSDTFVIEEFRVKDEIIPRGCAAETMDRILADGEKLPAETRLDDENLMIKVIVPTVSIYKTFREAPLDVLTNGDIEAINGFTSLFSETTSGITNNVNNPQVQRILSVFFVAQVKLFFNMLHCQPHSAMETQKAFVLKMISALRSNIGRMVEFGVNFDEQGELKQFLIEYADDNEVVPYLREAIKAQLIPLF